MIGFLKFVFVVGFFLALAAAGIFYHEPIINEARQIWTVYQAQTALAEENWSEAMVQYQKAYQWDPQDMELAQNLADVYAHQAKAHEDTGYVTYFSGDEANASADLSLPQKKTVEELRHEAEFLYRKVIYSDAQALGPRLGLAKLLQENPARVGEALTLYREALRYNRNDPRLLSALAQLYQQAAENPDEKRVPVKHWLFDWAIYYYRLSLQAQRTFQSYFDLGVAYQVRHGLEQTNLATPTLTKAARQYCNALVLDPNRYEARYNLGVTLVDMKAPDEGFRQLSKAVQLLMDADQVTQAQGLSQQIQGLRNRVFQESPADHQTVDDLPPWLQDCLKQTAS